MSRLSLVVLSTVMVLFALASVSNAQDPCSGYTCPAGYTPQLHSSICQCCVQQSNGVLDCYSATPSSCPSIPNCLRCTDPNVCDDCTPGYNVESGKCVVANCTVPNCIYCDALDPAYCAQCANGFSPNAAGQCVEDCNVVNCVTCVSGNANQCATCMTGYKPDASGACVAECNVANCRTCVAGNPNACDVCETGYGKTASSTCQLLTTEPTPTVTVPPTAEPGCLAPNCLTCRVGNPTFCETCKKGYEPNAQGVCVLTGCTVYNCIACTASSYFYCSQCIEGYYVLGGQCAQCQVPNCRQCSYTTPTQCEACLPGYTLSISGTCTAIDSPVAPTSAPCNVAYCKTCVLGNPSRCATCYSGYRLCNGSCTACRNAASLPQSMLLATFVMLLSVVAYLL